MLFDYYQIESANNNRIFIEISLEHLERILKYISQCGVFILSSFFSLLLFSFYSFIYYFLLFYFNVHIILLFLYFI